MQPCSNDFSVSATSRFGIEAEEFAESVAGEAHALRTVEAEQLRRRFAEADAALGARELGGEDHVAGLGAGGTAFSTAGFGVRIAVRVFSSPSLRSFVRQRSRQHSSLAFVELRGDDDAAFADGKGRIDRFGQSAANRWAGLEPIDHDFDVVPHLAVERQIVGQRHDPAVDASPHEALLAQVFEQVFVFALLAANDRGEHGELRARFRVSECGR